MRKLQTAEACAISQSVSSISNSGPLRSWRNRLSHTFFVSNLYKRYRKIYCVACVASVCHYSTVNASNQNVETDPLRSNFLFFFSCSLKSFDDLWSQSTMEPEQGNLYSFSLARTQKQIYSNKKTWKETIYLHPKTLQSSDKVRDYVQVVIPFESKWRAGNGYWSGLGLHC